VNKFLLPIIITFLTFGSSTVQAAQCPENGLFLQVLGSGSSILGTGRAAPGYLIWHQGNARILVEVGGGTASQFWKTGASFSDLDAILLTQVNSTHTADMATLMSSAIMGKRVTPLPVYGPAASKKSPSTVSFIRSLFDEKRGAFRDLGPLISPLGTKTFKLKPHDTVVKYKKSALGKKIINLKTPIFSNVNFKIYNFNVAGKKDARLGWLIRFGNKKIVFMGDVSPAMNNFQEVISGADILVVHHAIPESGPESARKKFLSPSAIGTLAYKSRTRQLILGHRRPATLGKEKETTAAIKSKYAGLVQFANDLDCFAL
jgi:ribonuclease BN (tRNA processing enzyme)